MSFHASIRTCSLLIALPLFFLTILPVSYGQSTSSSPSGSDANANANANVNPAPILNSYEEAYLRQELIRFSKPATGGYHISDGITAIDVTKLDYTARDWSRWDSYEPSFSLADLSFPTSSTHDIKQDLISNPRPNNLYQSLFTQKMRAENFVTQYNNYRAFSLSDFDIYANVLSDPINNYDYSDAMLNVSFVINEEYNLYRDAWKKNPSNAGQNFDNVEVDWKNLSPRVTNAISWLESYITVFLNTQHLTHDNSLDPVLNRGTTDAFGFWGNWNIYGMYFGHATIPFPLTHFTHLYSSPFLHKARTHIYAALSAFKISCDLMGDDKDFQISFTQELMRTTGWTLSTDFILRSEKELRKRGDWSDSTDGVSTSDYTNGKFTNADLTSITSDYVARVAARYRDFGGRDYNGAYTGVSLAWVGRALLHAPTNDVYTGLSIMWQRGLWDLAANYQPSAGTISSTGSRLHDMTTNVHNVHDHDHVQNYINILHPDKCKTNADPQFVSQCPSTYETPLVPASATLGQSVDTFYWAMYQAAGIAGYHRMY